MNKRAELKKQNAHMLIVWFVYVACARVVRRHQPINFNRCKTLAGWHGWPIEIGRLSLPRPWQSSKVKQKKKKLNKWVHMCWRCCHCVVCVCEWQTKTCSMSDQDYDWTGRDWLPSAQFLRKTVVHTIVPHNVITRKYSHIFTEVRTLRLHVQGYLIAEHTTMHLAI